MHHLEKDLKDVWSAKVQQAVQHAISSSSASPPPSIPIALVKRNFTSLMASSSLKQPQVRRVPHSLGCLFRRLFTKSAASGGKELGTWTPKASVLRHFWSGKGKDIAKSRLLGNKPAYLTTISLQTSWAEPFKPWHSNLWFTSPSFHLWTKVPLVPWCSAWKSTLTMRFTKTTWPLSMWKWLRLHQWLPVAWWLAGLRKITEIAAWEVTVNIW